MRLRGEGLSWRRTGDEIIVLDLDGSEYFALNASAAALWESFAEADRSAADLAGQLEKGYGIEPARAHADVAAFIGMLEQHGLIEP